MRYSCNEDDWTHSKEASVDGIGKLCRLEVGTESALDGSKSIKTFLMSLFAEHGNNDIEVQHLEPSFDKMSLLLRAHRSLQRGHQSCFSSTPALALSLMRALSIPQQRRT